MALAVHNRRRHHCAHRIIRLSNFPRYSSDYDCILPDGRGVLSSRPTWRSLYCPQERLLSSKRLDSDVANSRLSWNIALRVLGRWRWYACSLLESLSSISYRSKPFVIPFSPQFAISGETESFGSNNLMGQWLKAIGGYTVVQIGVHVISIGSYFGDCLRCCHQITIHLE
jgi:hypothetical protein